MLGAILMLAAMTSPSSAACPAAGKATMALHAADKVIARRDYRGANAALDEALAALGNAYAPPRTNDDTGMHLVLANSRQRQGKPKLAAEIKRRVLVERLDLCGRAGGRR